MDGWIDIISGKINQISEHYGGNFRLTGKMARVIFGGSQVTVTSNCMETDFLEEEGLKEGLRVEQMDCTDAKQDTC